MVEKMPELRSELENQVHIRTGRRIRNFCIDMFPGRVVLRGATATFHVKQLAQQGVRELLPNVNLENAITVD